MVEWTVCDLAEYCVLFLTPSLYITSFPAVRKLAHQGLMIRQSPCASTIARSHWHELEVVYGLVWEVI